MQRATLVGAITTALAATFACGASTTVSATGTGGAASSSGDASASGGTSGSDTGGAGGVVSTVAASIEFTVTGPASYCMTAQCDGPSIDLEDALGNRLTLGTSCGTVDCSTCEGTACTNVFCEPLGIAVTGARLDWNGTYYAPATCGSGMACVAPTRAKPGKYTATLCATPGKLTGPDGGQRQCVPNGAAKCGHVDFDFPSTTVVKGTVGP